MKRYLVGTRNFVKLREYQYGRKRVVKQGAGLDNSEI